MSTPIIDAHAHCGIQDRWPPQSFEDYKNLADGSGIREVVMFSPVMEIYNRYDINFKDSNEYCLKRKKSNAHLLTIGSSDLKVIPYFFIWNDFAIDQLTTRHKGIKWHRHSDEPVYHYNDPRCQTAVEEIRRRRIPVVLEEEFDNTRRFIDKIAPRVTVIIPHLGLLNGGYEVFVKNGIWKKDRVYTDTALAPEHVIADYINRYGCERILFGSDFPFGDPKSELLKILKLPIPETKKELITGVNLKRLLEDANGSG